MIDKNSVIGFIGQGWIGKNYANDFEARGFKTVRFSLEEPYVKNKNFIKDCDIVFIAVPTPTTPEGFSAHIVEDAISLVGKGKIALIKSTIVPGTTKKLQVKFPHCKVFYSPEFLSEATAQYDVENPFSNIVGVPELTEENKKLGEEILSILPNSPFQKVCTTSEAEMIKYTHNINGYIQIVMFNMLYDIAKNLDCDWSTIQSAVKADPMMSDRYSNPIHKSGRGAGGACFIKDLAALRGLYEKTFPKDIAGIEVFKSMERKNTNLLISTKKDLHLVEGVYGSALSVFKKSKIAATRNLKSLMSSFKIF